jgi:mannose-6-phosphate isomerase-like protein (cupin superfamily)
MRRIILACALAGILGAPAQAFDGRYSPANVAPQPAPLDLPVDLMAQAAPPLKETVIPNKAQFYDTFPGRSWETHYITPLEGDASRTVTLSTNTYPPVVGAASTADFIGYEFHRHPGDQWNTVVEGELTITIKGQPPRTLKVGDSVYIPRGTIHRTRNLTDKPTRTIELFIADKDRVGAEFVTEQ